VKFFHSPLLYCVTTLPSKTDTTANIDVKCLHFSRNVMLSVEYLVWWRQGTWSSSILERKLTAHTTAISSSKRVCSLTSEQYVVITGGHCSRIERQPTPPGPQWTIWKMSTSTSLNLTCGLQIALILIQWIALLGVLFSNESTTNDNSRRGRTEVSDSHRVAKTHTAFHW